MKRIITACLVLLFILSSCGNQSTPIPTTPPATPTEAATPTPTSLPTPTTGPILPLDANLQEAIQNTGDGEVIFLGAGTYVLDQGILVDKDLTLIGAGLNQTIITGLNAMEDANGKFAMIHYDSTGTLTLKGLTLSYTGADPSNVLRVENGQVKISDCRLMGAVPLADGSLLYDLVIMNSSSSHIENSIFEGNVEAGGKKIAGGIFIAGSTHLEVVNSQFNDSFHGVFFINTSTGSVESSTFSNHIGGVVAIDNTNVEIKANHFTGNDQGLGVVCSKDTTIKAEENIFDGLMSSIAMDDKCQATIEKNQSAGYMNSGIYMIGNATATIQENDFSGIPAADPLKSIGVLISKDASATVKSNQFSNDLIEIYVTDNAKADIQDNTISGSGVNEKYGISFEKETSGTVENNTISNVNVGTGIFNSATVNTLNNDISNCTLGIAYSNDATGQIQGNQLTANLGGVFLSDDTVVTVENNHIQGTDPEDIQFSNKGISFADNSAGTATANVISKQQKGINVSSSGAVNIEGNTISSSDDGLFFDSTAVPVVSNNIVSECEFGLYFAGLAKPSLTGNEVFSNKFAYFNDSKLLDDSWIEANNLHDNEN